MNRIAALIFYLIFIVRIFISVISPSLEKQLVIKAMLLETAFGFIAYATYNLTNYATQKGFPLNIVFIDLAWGAVLTSIVSVAGYYITKYIGSF